MDTYLIRSALRQCAWAVVRRAAPSYGRLAVGIRAWKRQERWGGFARPDQIVRWVAPRDLRSHGVPGNRLGLPALLSLCYLERELSCLGLDWGPGGSVGFELASGLPVVHAQSDLDLVIRAPGRIGPSFAVEILNLLRDSPGKVDCRVEAAWCGFSLEEYARSLTPSILVRTPAGPRLVTDPWAVSMEE